MRRRHGKVVVDLELHVVCTNAGAQDEPRAELHLIAHVRTNARHLLLPIERARTLLVREICARGRGCRDAIAVRPVEAVIAHALDVDTDARAVVEPEQLERRRGTRSAAPLRAIDSHDREGERIIKRTPATVDLREQLTRSHERVARRESGLHHGNFLARFLADLCRIGHPRRRVRLRLGQCAGVLRGWLVDAHRLQLEVGAAHGVERACVTIGEPLR